MEFILIIMAFIAFLLLLPYKRVYAWNGSRGLLGRNASYANVHYNDTKIWCMQEGMGEKYAEQVASSCSMVDTVHALDREWHLNSSSPGIGDSRDECFRYEYFCALQYLDYAEGFISQDSSMVQQLKQEALVHLGYSLHPLQDKFSHMSAGCNRPDIRIKHGELDKVSVLNSDGTFKEYKTQGDLFDNVDYDFYGDRESSPLSGQWYYLRQGGKYTNERWLDTEKATKNVVGSFMDYAEDKKIYFQ